MPTTLNTAAAAKSIDETKRFSPWRHVAILAAAGLFVSILLLTYGLDLSPGLF
jgi:ElaB/YqjD/DUF883 family membrane-anchored ribosome-binding protein